MKHPLRRGLLRLAAFLACLLVFVLLGDLFFMQTDTFARMMLLEMRERHDLDTVFIGSSVCRDHVNVQRISEATGKTCFNASIPCLAMQGSLAITRELYKTNSPETIVLVVEPYTFETEREGIEAEDIMMPWLSDPSVMAEYYGNLISADGWVLDRLLLFRDFGAQGPADILKNIGLRLFPHQTFALLGNESVDSGARVIYEGSGFVRYETENRADDAVKQKLQRQYTGWTYDLLPQSRELLLQYRDLLAEHDTQLLVLIYPNMTAHNLAEPSFLGYNESLMRFCRENGIECVNFALAKPELLPNLDSYYFDIYHLVGEGADIFSDAVARYLNLRASGADTASLFYGSSGEYLASVDFITNCWAERVNPKEKWNKAREQDKKTVLALAKDSDVYLANCNHGTPVVPQYRFSVVESDGSLTPLTDWQADGILTCEPGALDGKTLRAEARTGEGTEPVYYDFETTQPY